MLVLVCTMLDNVMIEKFCGPFEDDDTVGDDNDDDYDYDAGGGMKGFTIEGIYQQAGIHTLPHKRHLQIHLKGFQTVGIK